MAGTITLLERAREYVARFAEQNDEPEGGGCRSLLAEIDARIQPFKRQEEPVGALAIAAAQMRKAGA